jgi:hypothetical protein
MLEQTQNWKKLSERRYQAVINDEVVTLDVPYGKSEAIFTAFLSSGGVINEEGEVVTDPLTLIHSFRRVGDILLTKYDRAGEIIEEGHCADLSVTEVKTLFEVAMDVVTGFTETILLSNQKEQQSGTQVKAKGSKSK